MRTSVRLGRIFGVPVGINWSLLAIAFLLTVGLALGRFPDVFPGESATAYWVVATGTAVLFFASVLAHELAHAVVARRHGVRVEGITLWLLGGVAKLDGEAPRASAAAGIAAAGPATSLAAAGLFAGVAFAGEFLGVVPALVGSGLWWLAFINALLAAFNLVPAAPLDGGRLLAALLWWRHGDRRRATITAARAGRLFGGVLVGLGFVAVLTGAGLGGLWFALIGWFVMGTARAEESWAETERDLGGVTVAEVMTRGPETVPGWLTVEALTGDRRMLRHRVYPVLAWEGGVAGVVSIDGLHRVPWNQRAHVRVADVSTPLRALPTATPGERLVDVVRRAERVPGGPVLVFDRAPTTTGGPEQVAALVGVVTASDIRRAARLASLRRDGGFSESAA